LPTKFKLGCRRYEEVECLLGTRIHIPSISRVLLDHQGLDSSLMAREGIINYLCGLDNDDREGELVANKVQRNSSRLPGECFATSMCEVDGFRVDVSVFMEGSLAMSAMSALREENLPGTKDSLVPLEILRLVNHVPLPDSSAAVACGICAALSSSYFVRTLEVRMPCKTRKHRSDFSLS
jgi:hypothetical protein